MRTVVSIPGIHCNSCIVLIKDVSQDFPSIQFVTADLHSKIVTLQHDGHLRLPDWTSAVESLNANYKVQPLSESL